jgi:hypothetical protein
MLRVKIPWSLSDCAQASGRRGRGGEPVDVVVVIQHSDEQSIANRPVIVAWGQQTACKRLPIARNQYNDNVGRKRPARIFQVNEPSPSRLRSFCRFNRTHLSGRRTHTSRPHANKMHLTTTALPIFSSLVFPRADLSLTSQAIANTSDWTTQNSSYLSTTLQPSQQPFNASSAIFPLRFNKRGNFTIRIATPGCLRDQTCAQRGRVNVTVYMDPPVCGGVELSEGETTIIAQTNEQDKYDEVFSGWVPGVVGDFVPKLVLQPASGQAGPLTVVAQAAILTMLGKEAGDSFDACGVETVQKVDNNGTDTDTAARDSSTALTKGARAGIGVGATISAIGVVLVTVLVWMRRQRMKEESAAAWLEKPELEANDVPRHQWLAESNGTAIGEMPGNAQPVELEADVVVREMPAHQSRSP